MATIGSTEFKALAKSTQDVYRNILNRFVDKHGNGPIAGIQAKHVNKLIDEMADTPSAASNFRKRLKSVMDYAVSAGHARRQSSCRGQEGEAETTGTAHGQRKISPHFVGAGLLALRYALPWNCCCIPACGAATP